VTATHKQVVEAYKQLSARYHPDRNPDDDEALAAYELVSDAYHTLSDSEKRLRYDRDVLGLEVSREDLLAYKRDEDR
jgi:molecular chaperone DnaJ